MERACAAHDLNGYCCVNHEFRTAVQALAAKRWLDRVDRAWADLRRFMCQWRGRQFKLPSRTDASIQEHRDLLAAVLQRDVPHAELAMQAHLTARSRALKALQRFETGCPPDRSVEKPKSRRAEEIFGATCGWRIVVWGRPIACPNFPILASPTPKLAPKRSPARTPPASTAL